MNDHERERRAQEAREKHRAEVQARVDKALGDPGLKAALVDLKAQTPEGEAMFGFQVKVADARAEVPAAEEIATEEGVALVTQKEAAAAYVAAKVPKRMSPRMPTGRIKVPMRTEEIAQRRQATMPSLRKHEAAGMRGGAAAESIDESTLTDEGASTEEEAADVEERAITASEDASAAMEHADASSVSVRPAEVVAVRAATSARRNAGGGTRRGRAIGAVLLLGAMVIAIGLLRGRSTGSVANGLSDAPTTARAESAAVFGVAAPTCANMGPPPCPTVSETAEPVGTANAGVGNAGPRVNASAPTSGAASTAAKAKGPSMDEVYADAEAPTGSATASTVPSAAPTPAPSPTLTAPGISPTPTSTASKPDRFGEQLDHHR